MKQTEATSVLRAARSYAPDVSMLREGAGLRSNAAPVRARYQGLQLKLDSGQLDDSQR